MGWYDWLVLGLVAFFWLGASMWMGGMNLWGCWERLNPFGRYVKITKWLKRAFSKTEIAENRPRIGRNS